jgi:hypothetical protein
LKAGRKVVARKASPAASVVIPASRSSATRRSCRVFQRRFDPPLRLGALGHEMGNHEGGERVADLRRVLMALELLGERPVRIVADEDPVLVGVHRRRQSHRLAEGA